MNDVGDIIVLRPDEWTKRKKQYREVAEQHLLTCQHRDVNLYLRQKSSGRRRNRVSGSSHA
jgi:hypothetical protein